MMCEFTTRHPLQTDAVAQEDIAYDMARDVSCCDTASEHTFISLRVLPSPFSAPTEVMCGVAPVATHNHGYMSYARK